MSIDLTFFGAAKTVTGSKFVLRSRKSSVLNEFGLFQGPRKKSFEINSQVPKEAIQADAMVLSHAHIDHSGNIPRLVREGYDGPIFATPATIDLATIMLMDSAEIQMHDVEYVNKKHLKKGKPLVEPLYTVDDAQKANQHFHPIPYHETREIAPGVRTTLYDAGHILGSAQVLHEISGMRILFTGDLGQPRLPIVRDPETVPDPDVIICESTYGGRVHPPVDDAKDRLRKILTDAYNRQAKVVVPAFSVGRTQALVLVMHQLMEEGSLPEMPIRVDSPLSLEATRVFRKHPECYDDETWEYLQRDEDPFGFKRLRYVKTVEESKALNNLQEPFVIIAASGMCEGGRVVHHLKDIVENENNLILITGFQAPGTLGRRIVEGQKDLHLYGEEFTLNCQVETLNEYSAHADREDLLKMFAGYNPRKVKQVFLIHGDPDQIDKLAQAVTEMGYPNVNTPETGQTFELR